MAVRTETVQFHSCDLCEQDVEEAELTRLYGPLQAGKRSQIDICPSCQQRPIVDVITWMHRTRKAAAPTPLRSVRHTTR